ncbi:MAG: 4Fe-4S dicluster domain-containing protein, partial [Desulfobacteraceae bacterium]
MKIRIRSGGAIFTGLGTGEIMPIRISTKTVDKDFLAKLEKLSGQKVHQCFQCGTCGGSCPMGEHMDALPRKIIHMAQLGISEEIE